MRLEAGRMELTEFRRGEGMRKRVKKQKACMQLGRLIHQRHAEQREGRRGRK